MTPRSTLPPIAAVLAALAVVAERASALAITLTSGVPTPGTLSLASLTGQVLSFLFLFVLLFALAAALAEGVDTFLAGVSGAAGVLGALVAGVALLAFIGSSQLVFDAALMVSTSVMTGVKAGVVVLAGSALSG